MLTTASSIADRVTTILHPSYEAYLVKFFSHSHLPLCTEDSVVLKSVSISKPWREVNRRRLFLRVTTRVITTCLSALMIHLSCFMNSVLIGFPIILLCLISVLRRVLIALYRYYLILRESRYCREQQTAYSFQLQIGCGMAAMSETQLLAASNPQSTPPPSAQWPVAATCLKYGSGKGASPPEKSVVANGAGRCN